MTTLTARSTYIHETYVHPNNKNPNEFDSLSRISIHRSDFPSTKMRLFQPLSYSLSLSRSSKKVG